MENLDLSILEKVPEPNLNVILEIEPLAPLSMVSELPGSYYKTLKSPDKKMLCGLFENILGWHIDLADRKAIIKELTALRKQQAKKNPQIAFVDRTKGSTYNPLLMDFFEIELPVIPPQLSHYDDLWSRAFRRTDSYRHTFGTRYMNTAFIERWNQIKERVDNDAKRKSNDKETLKTKLFTRYMGNFPMYYSTPTKREFIQYGGNFQLKLSIDSCLFEQLGAHLQTENIGYLGSSEGWVNVTIKEFAL
ncbi:MAG: type I-PGING CRISPR-associated protein Cas5p [Bacteroidota bacterium]|nr:type I-PGING CRISPR-associated protein Cas5p [Bacteroidota bacterium]